MHTPLRLASFALLAATITACATPSPTTDVGVDAASALDGAGGNDAATTSDSANPNDARTDTAAPDTGADAGGPNGVSCSGAGQCATGQVCCGGSTAIVCQASTAACTGPTLACDGTEDCPGAHCCENSGTTCMATCTGLTICHTSAECAVGDSCCPNGGGVPQGRLSHCVTLAAGATCPLPP